MAPRTCFAVTLRGMKPNNGGFVELAIVFGLELEVRVQASHYYVVSPRQRNCVGWKRGGLRSARTQLRSFASFRSFRDATGEA